ncbi:MAG: hypothetical protein AAGA91_15510 [Pseudomonadota bacterium]
MNTLILLLLGIFVGVGLMVVLGERFASPMEPERMARLQRWLWPLVFLSILLGIGQHYL